MEQLPADYRDPAPFSVTVQGHALTFYPGGRDRLARLLALIDSARTSIRMSFYIFANDACGRAVLGALVSARGRGVEVSLLIDSFGSKNTSHAMFAPLLNAGGRYCSFSARWGVRYLIRNHQKIVVIDDTVGMIGGFNVEHDYFAPPQANGWNDLALELTGPVVAELVRWYDLLEKWTRQERGQHLHRPAVGELRGGIGAHVRREHGSDLHHASDPRRQSHHPALDLRGRRRGERADEIDVLAVDADRAVGSEARQQRVDEQRITACGTEQRQGSGS